ncbi:MAG: hypothetical protein O3C04_02075 [Crenarchaeota archaeon]|nr:hypothetical protein [Thermoproteota archaeon]MDA1124418.1 hypothetical protein [Thermoproteota archaeon]
MVPDPLVESSFEIITSEYEKLRQTIEIITKISQKSIPDIVNLYYQAVIVKTLIKKLKEDFESSDVFEHKKLLGKIEEVEKYLIDNFTKSLHPEILTQLTNSIQSSTENLKLLGQNSEQKTKETIENEALLYKNLRELMSTKEFVEQYEIGLKNV